MRPHSLRDLSLLAVSLLALGCMPRLTEGRFDCTDGACPTGWNCRASDHRCYVGPGSDAGVGDASVDAPGLRAFFEPCRRNSDCASGECYFGDLDPNLTGYCTQTCMDNSQCAGLVDGTTECSMPFAPPRVCTVLCGLDAFVCPAGSACALIDRVTVGEEYGECLAPGALPQPVEMSTCVNDDACVVGICVTIVGATMAACARPCGGEGVCALGERCVPSSRGMVCAP